MKKLTTVLLCVTLYLLAVGCKKEDYSVKASPFGLHSLIRLKEGWTTRHSFVPHCGGQYPLRIDKMYTIADEIYWYYDVHDTTGCILIHVDNDQVVKWNGAADVDLDATGYNIIPDSIMKKLKGIKP